MQAEEFSKKADDIKLPTHDESEDNALYAGSRSDANVWIPFFVGSAQISDRCFCGTVACRTSKSRSETGVSNGKVSTKMRL